MDENIENLVYRFESFTVDVTRRRIFRDGEPIALTSKSLDTLLYLIRHQGTTVSKTDLMNAVWDDAVVEENNLTQQVSALRRALGERPRDHRFIVTVPGRGYCFVAEVSRGAAGDEAPLKTLPTRRFEPAVIRGYSLAICQILLVALVFAYSAIGDRYSGRQQSLAVMNFKVTAGDEFIGNGISETLRARLGSVEDLTVRPVAVDQDAIAAGQRLQVDRVVTGSVQREEGRIRVAVEMVDVADGRIVWGKTFDEDATNVFELQDAIAGEVARVLKVRFSSALFDRDLETFIFST